MKRLTLLLLAFLLPLPALAQAAVAPPSAAGSVTQMILGLCAVLALLYGALWLLKRMQLGNKAIVGGLKVLSATSVGPRERVVLVAAGKRVLVLGVAPGRVNMLHLMDEEDVQLAAPTSTPSATPAQDFAARLKQFIERGQRGKN